MYIKVKKWISYWLDVYTRLRVNVFFCDFICVSVWG